SAAPAPQQAGAGPDEGGDAEQHERDGGAGGGQLAATGPGRRRGGRRHRGRGCGRRRRGRLAVVTEHGDGEGRRRRAVGRGDAEDPAVGARLGEGVLDLEEVLPVDGELVALAGGEDRRGHRLAAVSEVDGRL